MRINKGFTIIEIVATLILVGIVAISIGMFLVDGIKGYLFARNNIEINQKTTIASERMRRELAVLISVSSAGANSISFNSSLGQRTLGLDGTNVRLVSDSSPLASGDILLGNVSNLVITYTAYDGLNWNINDGDANLAKISINMTIPFDDPSLNSRTVSITVNPHNTGKDIAPSP